LGEASASFALSARDIYRVQDSRHQTHSYEPYGIPYRRWIVLLAGIQTASVPMNDTCHQMPY
jgi:hypothetical protein